MILTNMRVVRVKFVKNKFTLPTRNQSNLLGNEMPTAIVTGANGSGEGASDMYLRTRRRRNTTFTPRTLVGDNER